MKIKRKKKKKDNNIIKIKKQHVLSFIHPKNEKDEFFWISTEWITDWINGKINLSPIDNSLLLCDHQKLDPKKTNKMKLISKDAWQYFVDNYKGGPALSSQSDYYPCEYCCVAICKALQEENSKLRIKKHYCDLIGNQNGIDGVWISRTWILDWKKQEPTSKNMTEKIICAHNKRKTNHALCSKIPKEVWDYLILEYQGMEISTNEGACEKCLDAEENLRQLENSKRDEREAEKKELSEIYKDYPVKKDDSRYFLIGIRWISDWRLYIDATGELLHSDFAPATITSSQFICPHNMLKYDPAQLFESTPDQLLESPFIQVSEKTWKNLQNRYGKNEEGITCQRIEGSLITEPEVCPHGCVDEQQKKDFEDKLCYTNQDIFVVKRDSKASNNSTSTNSDNKHRMRTRGSDQRRRISNVSATDTVQHLKMLIFDVTNLSPIQLKLYKGDTVLDQDELTLAQVGVIPGITLQYEEVEENLELLDDREPEFEEGFKGTTLYTLAQQTGSSSSESEEEIEQPNKKVKSYHINKEEDLK